MRYLKVKNFNNFRYKGDYERGHVKLLNSQFLRLQSDCGRYNLFLNLRFASLHTDKEDKTNIGFLFSFKDDYEIELYDLQEKLSIYIDFDDIFEFFPQFEEVVFKKETKVVENDDDYIDVSYVEDIKKEIENEEKTKNRKSNIRRVRRNRK